MGSRKLTAYFNGFGWTRWGMHDLLTPHIFCQPHEIPKSRQNRRKIMEIGSIIQL